MSGIDIQITNDRSYPQQDLTIARRDADETDIQIFTQQERDRIIDDLKQSKSEYAGLIEFAFRTGCRPGEVTAPHNGSQSQG
jgi:hypothetical protein